jgi:hypothetical protein
MDERDAHRRAAQYRLERLEAEDRALHHVADEGLDDASTVEGAASQGAERVGSEAAGGQPPGGEASGRAERAGSGPRPPSVATRGAFADELVRQAMARGEFDDLPLTGKPIPGLTGRYDPDWWLKSFIEREQITGVLPEALQLRKDDAVLDEQLDAEHLESRVRETLEEFNARVIEARRQLLGGPPVVTPTRDVESEVVRWRERRRARQVATDTARESRPGAGRAARSGESRWWWAGRRSRGGGRAERDGGARGED